MASPEYPLQSPMFFAPDAGADGATPNKPESFQNPLFESADSSGTSSSTGGVPASGIHFDSSRWPEAGLLPITGEVPDNPIEPSDKGQDDDNVDEDPGTLWPPGRTNTVYIDLGLNRQKDLSPAANWLVERLLAGARDLGEELDYLQRRADNEGIDLQAAIEELTNHSLLVSRKPGWIDLPRTTRPGKDSGRK